MQQIIFFFQKYKYFLFFVVLEIIALNLTIRNHSFHKSKFISSTNYITGWFLQKRTNISDYFSLKSQNETLAEENIRLKNLLSEKTSSIFTDSIQKDSIFYNQKYLYINVRVIANNYHTPYNFITINKGKKQGIKSEMAVTNSKGIIGITEYTTKNYTRVRSILNKNSKINARLKNSFHFGTLLWDGKDYNIVQLTDIPRQAILKKGDTVITGGKSTIFPEGIPIGTILEVPENKKALNKINIKLFNDMSNLGHIYVIENTHQSEIKNVENTINE